MAIIFAGWAISGCEFAASDELKTATLQCISMTRGELGDVEPAPSGDNRLLAYRAYTHESPLAGELRLLPVSNPDEDRVLLRPADFHGGSSWSPDGEWISYTRLENLDDDTSLVGKSIYRVNVVTGESLLVVDAKRYEGLGVPTAWISERSIVFGTRSALFSVDPLGGEPELLITFPTEMYNPPSHLAADEGGNRVLFSVVADDTERSVNKDPPGSGIWLADLGRQSLTRLTDGREDVYPIWYECVFRAMWATDSGRCGPPIPGHVGHRFRAMWATLWVPDSGGSRSIV